MLRSTPVPSRWWYAVLVVAVLGATGWLGGCARTLEAVPAAPAKVHPRWPGCEATGAFDDPDRLTGPPAPGLIPDGFVAVEAVVCGSREQTTVDGEVVQVALERRATDIALLLSYLARPSKTTSRPDDLVCPAMAVQPTWLFLTDATGRWVTPAVPTDTCGFPLDIFTEPGPAYQQLSFRDTVGKRLRIVESAEARQSGCSMRWKNMVQVEVDAATRRAPIAADPFDGGDIRVCRYSVAQDEISGATPTGDLLGGQVVDGRQRRALLRALVGSPAAPRACDEQASRLGLLRSLDGNRTLYVELDGCRRILGPGGAGGSGSLAQAGPDLVRRVEALGR